MDRLPQLTGPDLAALATSTEVVGFLGDALRSGQVDVERASARTFTDAPNGELLMMPETGAAWSGVKVLTVTPGNPARGLPKIQGVYTLFENDGLRPVAILDAVELTLLRTPATTVLAVAALLAAGPPRALGEPLPVAVIGTGPQAERHLICLASVVGPVDAVVIGRRPQAAAEVAERCAGRGIAVRAGSIDDIEGAAVVICVTSSATPVLPDRLVGPDTVVAAVGSHGRDRAELPPELVRRSDVAVESRDAAMRESGNLLGARPAERWANERVWNLADLARGDVTRTAGRPAVFSGVGMAWQDLVTASALYQRHLCRHLDQPHRARRNP